MRLAAYVLALGGVLLFGLARAGTVGDKRPSAKDLYKQNCRVCHDKGSPNGEYSPMSLIQDQWKSFFNSKFLPTHRDLTLPGRTEKLLEGLTPEQLKSIQKFCIDHAADSEQPQSCS